MRDPILITGASGFVGSAIVRAALDDGEAIGMARRSCPMPMNGLSWVEGDCMDGDFLQRALTTTGATACIHAAANPSIDACESDPDMAQRVNAEGAATVARVCAEAGVRLVHVSTDTVFDGERPPYGEDDIAEPINAYGESKLRAERFVAMVNPAAAIARIPLIVGFNLWPRGRSFMTRMKQQLIDGEPIRVSAQEIRTPLDVITAGRALVELARNDYEGILHVAGADVVDRVTLTRRIAERMGHSGDAVSDVPASELKGRAPRPRDISLDTTRAQALLRTPLCGFEAGLDLVFSEGFVPK